MDHSIDELDACVFDYLCAIADEPITFMQIMQFLEKLDTDVLHWRIHTINKNIKIDL